MPHIAYTGLDGEVWPSATQLTRLLPQNWLWAHYKKHVKSYGWRGWQWCNAHSKRAMRLGTHTHSLVEAALKHDDAPICYLDDEQTVREPERRMELVRAWAQALIETTVKDQIAEIEKKTVNKKEKEHGTVDAISVEDDGKSYFPKDWKTSGSISIEYPIQLAIYNRCLEYEGYKMAGYGEIERVDKLLKSVASQKSGKHHVQVKRIDNLQSYYPVVDALHTIYNYVNSLGPWKKQPEEKKSEAC